MQGAPVIPLTLRTLLLALAAMAAALLFGAPAEQVGTADYDCSDFANQAEAEEHLLRGEGSRAQKVTSSMGLSQ
jgi:hypothetical protein